MDHSPRAATDTNDGGKVVADEACALPVREERLQGNLKLRSVVDRE